MSANDSAYRLRSWFVSIGPGGINRPPASTKYVPSGKFTPGVDVRRVANMDNIFEAVLQSQVDPVVEQPVGLVNVAGLACPKRNRQGNVRLQIAETIHGWIYRAGQKTERLWRFLTRAMPGEGSATLGRLAIRSEKIHISQRSDDADARETVGHWPFGDAGSRPRYLQALPPGAGAPRAQDPDHADDAPCRQDRRRDHRRDDGHLSAARPQDARFIRRGNRFIGPFSDPPHPSTTTPASPATCCCAGC